MTGNVAASDLLEYGIRASISLHEWFQTHLYKIEGPESDASERACLQVVKAHSPKPYNHMSASSAVSSELDILIQIVFQELVQQNRHRAVSRRTRYTLLRTERAASQLPHAWGPGIKYRHLKVQSSMLSLCAEYKSAYPSSSPRQGQLELSSSPHGE